MYELSSKLHLVAPILYNSDWWFGLGIYIL